MRWVFAAWALPMGIFWGWYFLSLNDMNFGYVMLTREVNDLLFQLYGQILGIEPTTIPALVAKACILDTLLILAIWAFRRRHAIAAWFTRRFGATSEQHLRRVREAGRARPAG
jgi:hypothetical protein